MRDCPDCAARCVWHEVERRFLWLLVFGVLIAISATVWGCSDRHEITRPHRGLPTDPTPGFDSVTFANTRWHDRALASDPACPLVIFDDNTLQLTVPYSVQVADTGLYKWRKGYAVFQHDGAMPPLPGDSLVLTPYLYGSHSVFGEADPRQGSARIVFSWRTPVFREVVYEESTGRYVALYDTLPAWRIDPPQIQGAQADKQVRVLTEAQ